MGMNTEWLACQTHIFVITSIFLFKLEDSMELWQLFPVISMFRFIEMSSSVALSLVWIATLSNFRFQKTASYKLKDFAPN